MMRFFREGSFALFLFPTVVASVLGVFTPERATNATADVPDRLEEELLPVVAQAASELEQLFNDLDYQWLPAKDMQQVPALSVESLPRDLDTVDVQQRKALFFRIVAPLVVAGNQKILEQREFLEQAFADNETLAEDEVLFRQVSEIASRFNIDGDLDDPVMRATLLKRVDVIPLSLALAQAANESGWGTSRFAREANNLFGMWTWDATSGLLPDNRPTDARHFVRVFTSLRDAVDNYLHTINVGDAYRDLREMRRQQRRLGEHPDGWTLAAGLSGYSARGDEYVAEIRSIIRFNKLHHLPRLDIDQHPLLADRS